MSNYANILDKTIFFRIALFNLMFIDYYYNKRVPFLLRVNTGHKGHERVIILFSRSIAFDLEVPRM